MSSLGLFLLSASGQYVEASADQVVAAARNVLDARVAGGQALASAQSVRDFLALRLGALPHEVFCVLFLDSQNRLIDFVEMFRGTITQASVYPREVVKEALARNAASVILAHPHPSGVAEPSPADQLLTRTLRDALALVDVRVLDHFVIAGGQALSMAEKGLM